MDKPKRELSIIGKICVTFFIILVILTIACRIIVSRNVERMKNMESQNNTNQVIDK